MLKIHHIYVILIIFLLKFVHFWHFTKSMTLDPCPVYNTIIKSCLSWISDQQGKNYINMEFISIIRLFYSINYMRALVKYKE